MNMTERDDFWRNRKLNELPKNICFEGQLKTIYISTNFYRVVSISKLINPNTDYKSLTQPYPKWWPAEV